MLKSSFNGFKTPIKTWEELLGNDTPKKHSKATNKPKITADSFSKPRDIKEQTNAVNTLTKANDKNTQSIRSNVKASERTPEQAKAVRKELASQFKTVDSLGKAKEKDLDITKKGISANIKAAESAKQHRKGISGQVQELKSLNKVSSQSSKIGIGDKISGVTKGIGGVAKNLLSGVGGMLATGALYGGATLAISKGLEYGYKGYQKLTNGVNMSRQAHIDRRNALVGENKAISSNINFLQNNKKEYDSLRNKQKQLSNTPYENMSESQKADMDKLKAYNEKIADMFPNMVKGYDKDGNPIVSMSANADGLIKRLKVAQESKERLIKQENQSIADKNLTEMTRGESIGDSIIGRINNKNKSVSDYYKNLAKQSMKDYAFTDMSKFLPKNKTHSDALLGDDSWKKRQAKWKEGYNSYKKEVDKTYGELANDIAKYDKANAHNASVGQQSLLDSGRFKNLKNSAKEAISEMGSMLTWGKISTTDGVSFLNKLGENADPSKIQNWTKQLNKLNEAYKMDKDRQTYQAGIKSLADEMAKSTNGRAKDYIKMLEDVDRGYANLEEKRTADYMKKKGTKFSDLMEGGSKGSYADKVQQEIRDIMSAEQLLMNARTTAQKKNALSEIASYDGLGSGVQNWAKALSNQNGISDASMSAFSKVLGAIENYDPKNKNAAKDLSNIKKALNTGDIKNGMSIADVLSLTKDELEAIRNIDPNGNAGNIFEKMLTGGEQLKNSLKNVQDFYSKGDNKIELEAEVALKIADANLNTKELEGLEKAVQKIEDSKKNMFRGEGAKYFSGTNGDVNKAYENMSKTDEGVKFAIRSGASEEVNKYREGVSRLSDSYNQLNSEMKKSIDSLSGKEFSSYLDTFSKLDDKMKSFVKNNNIVSESGIKAASGLYDIGKSTGLSDIQSETMVKVVISTVGEEGASRVKSYLDSLPAEKRVNVTAQLSGENGEGFAQGYDALMQHFNGDTKLVQKVAFELENQGQGDLISQLRPDNLKETLKVKAEIDIDNMDGFSGKELPPKKQRVEIEESETSGSKELPPKKQKVTPEIATDALNGGFAGLNAHLPPIKQKVEIEQPAPPAPIEAAPYIFQKPVIPQPDPPQVGPIAAPQVETPVTPEPTLPAMPALPAPQMQAPTMPVPIMPVLPVFPAPIVGTPIIPKPTLPSMGTIPAPKIGMPTVPKPSLPKMDTIAAPKVNTPKVPAPTMPKVEPIKISIPSVKVPDVKGQLAKIPKSTTATVRVIDNASGPARAAAGAVRSFPTGTRVATLITKYVTQGSPGGGGGKGGGKSLDIKRDEIDSKLEKLKKLKNSNYFNLKDLSIFRKKNTQLNPLATAPVMGAVATSDGSMSTPIGGYIGGTASPMDEDIVSLVNEFKNRTLKGFDYKGITALDRLSYSLKEIQFGLKEDINLLHEMERAVNRVNNSIKRIDLNMQRARGSEKVSMLFLQNDQIRESIRRSQAHRAALVVERDAYRNMLRTEGFKFTPDGTLTANYYAQMAKYKERDLAIEKELEKLKDGKGADSKRKKLEEEKKEIERKRKTLDEYEKTVDKIVDVDYGIKEHEVKIDNNVDEVEKLRISAWKENYEAATKIMDSAIKAINNSLDIYSIKFKYAFGMDRLNILDAQTSKYREMNTVIESNINTLNNLKSNLQGRLEKHGFTFNGDNISNYQTHMAQLKDTSTLYEDIKSLASQYFDIVESKIPDYNKKMEEMNQKVKDNAKQKLEDTKTIEDKITSMLKKQADERIKAIEKESKAREDAIKKKKDEYNEARKEADYQDDYQKKLKEIEKLEKKRDIYTKDTSQKGQKELQKINEELEKKVEELQKSVEKHVDDKVNKIYDDESKRLADELKELKEKRDEEYTDAELLKKAQEAIQSGQFTDWDGNVKDLQTALIDYMNEFEGGLSATGALIQAELIAKLKVANDTIASFKENLDILGVGDYNLGGYIQHSKYNELEDRRKESTNNITYNKSLVEIQGNVDTGTYEKILAEVQKYIKQHERDLRSNIR